MASSHEIETLLGNSIFRLEQGVGRCAKGEFSGQLYFDVCLSWRVLGMCRMLLEADADAFASALGRSAQARIEYLSRWRDEAEPDPNWICLSKNLPFEDALAAGALADARTVSELSPLAWERDAEDEDDHRWCLFLHRAFRALRDGTGPSLGAILDDMAALRDDDEDPRAAVARTLAARDPGAFLESLEATLDAREAKIRTARKTPGTSKELLATDGALWIQGLAVLRLAELGGMVVTGEFRYLPAEARVPVMAGSIPQGSWLDVPSE